MAVKACRWTVGVYSKTMENLAFWNGVKNAYLQMDNENFGFNPHTQGSQDHSFWDQGFQYAFGVAVPA